MSNFPACVEDDVVITIDARLAYRDDMTSEWTTKFHSVEQRPLRCTFAVSKVNLHDFMLYTEMRNSYTFLCLVRKNPVFFSDVWKRRALLSLWPNTIHGAGKCSPQIFFNEPAFASEWHNERWHRGNKGHPCSGEYNFYMLTSVIRHVVFELISKLKIWHSDIWCPSSSSGHPPEWRLHQSVDQHEDCVQSLDISGYSLVLVQDSALGETSGPFGKVCFG